MLWRVNTPGPSFTVEADTLDRATCLAASGLPVPSVMNGWQLTQTERDGIRVVTRWTRNGRAVTGFSIYPE